MEIINLTPHSITFISQEGAPVLVVKPSGIVARVTPTTTIVGEIEGIPVTATTFGEIEGLPDPETDKIFIVSSIVAGRVPDRTDVFIPNESVRDNEGRIIGCRSLGKI